MKAVLIVIPALLLATACACAQTLLYQWNFNNTTGVGATLTAAPSYIDATMSGGIMTNSNGGEGLSAPSGSGVFGSVSAIDLGILNTSEYRSAAGVFSAGAGDLSPLNSFTVSLWFNLNATVTNFSSLNDGALLSRLVDIATTPTGDGDELYFSLNNGTNLQFGVNRASTGNITTANAFPALGISPTPAIMTNIWIFVAASYTPVAGGTVNLYTGTTTSNATLAATLTSVGIMAWSATTNFILIGNRGDGTRSLPGTVDNVTIYSGAQTPTQIIAVQTNAFVSGGVDWPTAGVPVVSPSYTVNIGSSITIMSPFGGAAPLFLQWQTDGGGGTLTNIPNATNATLTVTPFKTGTFQYALIVTNNYGSATSAVAVVTVEPLPGTVNVTVDVMQTMTTMPTNGLGVCTAIYDNNLITSSIAPLLSAAGISAVRFPGGSVSDAYNWQNNTGIDGQYVNANDSFTNLIATIVNPAGAHAVLTVNYGSNASNIAGGDTNMAAAWVAFANVTNHLGVKYWEIGNEVYGNGYYGTNLNWEYDLHYPETNAQTRVGQTIISPSAYGTNAVQFIGAMKAKDATIKCGVPFDPGDVAYNAQMLAQCGSSADFVIIHWYPDGNATSVLASTTQIPATAASTREQLTNAVGATHAAQMEICITETGAGTVTGAPVSLFAADNYLTWLENGAVNVDYQILHNDLLTTGQQPGHAYYGAMMAHLLANIGDALLVTTSDRSTLRVHASSRADGKVGVMLVNTDSAQTNSVTVNINGFALGSSGIVYQFGVANFTGTNDVPSFSVATNSISALGNQFTLSVPPYTMIDVLIPPASNTPPALAPVSNQTVNPGQTVAFTTSAVDTNVPAQTLIFTLSAGETNATLVQVNNTNANFTWRPLITQADSTNVFTLKVADSGTPVMSVTENFSIVVNSITLPALTNLAGAGEQFGFRVSGAIGPDLEIQASTNLTQWSAVFISNSPTMPFDWMDTNIHPPMRFYRAVIGPPLPATNVDGFQN